MTSGKISIYKFQDYFDPQTTGGGKKKPLHESQLDHFGSIIYHSSKSERYVVKIDLSSFPDKKSDDIVYLSCKALFLQFSSKCTIPNITDLVTCTRGGDSINFTNHVPPTNMVLSKGDKFKAFFQEWFDN